MKLRKIEEDDPGALIAQMDAAVMAVKYLRHAIELLKRADCPKTLLRARLTLSSAKGALRNIHYRQMRFEERRGR